jgi:hypothetical protein
VLTQSANGVLLPNDFAVFGLNVVLSLKLAKGDGFRIGGNGVDVVACPLPALA